MSLSLAQLTGILATDSLQTSPTLDIPLVEENFPVQGCLPQDLWPKTASSVGESQQDLAFLTVWTTPMSSPPSEVRRRLAEVLVTIVSKPPFLPLPCFAIFSSPQVLLTSRVPPNSLAASNLCARVCLTDRVQCSGLLSTWEHWFQLCAFTC